MIQKLHVLFDNKLVLNKFLIKLDQGFLTINSLDITNNIIQVPVYNKFNGLDYVPISFPLEIPVIKNNVFNPHVLISSYNLLVENDIDFFYQLEKLSGTHLKLNWIKFESLLDDKINFAKIINNYYLDYINLENLKGITDLNTFVSKLWSSIIIIKMLTIWVLVKFPNISNKNIKEITSKYNIPKKILSYANQIKSFKYNLTQNVDFAMNLNEYLNTNFNSSIKLSELKPASTYYILVNKNDSSTISQTATEIVTSGNQINKLIKISVKKINKNVITISETKNIIFENYKWFYFHPNIVINNDYIYYQTFINDQFACEIIKQILNIDPIHSKKIVEYFNKENKLSNLMSLGSCFSEIQNHFTDFEILKSNSYSDGFFEYITKKYSGENNKLYEILAILFNNYTYPLKNTRHELDPVFDNLLYFSLYNYKLIFINTKNSPTYSNDLLHPNINNIIPIKLKNLYINLVKAMSQMINNNFESVTYNQKFYSDYLHRNIIKILLSNNNQLTTGLLKNLIKGSNMEKFQNIISTNMLLIDISNKLNWNNLPKKLNYLGFFYKNDDIVHYQDKINKNIMPDNFDGRIKKVIENPFEMYKFLRKEKDFIKWTKFISDKVIQLYYVPISLSSEDFGLIGKLIYLLVNINDQNTKDPSYINFINFCNLNNKLILDSNRINLKIREYFPNLKTNINLGFLAKHLTWDKEAITFEEQNKDQDKTPDVLALEMKLHIATKKYYKYKAKYLETKDEDIDTAIINFKEDHKKLVSDTSSVLPK